MNIKKQNSKLISGIFWSVVESLIKRVLDLIVRLTLAIVLLPSDFGIIGMATVFISFVQVINDAGIYAALIQRKDEDLTDAHYHTTFWTQMIWSILLYFFCVIVLAPLVAQFYNEPILAKIMPFLCITFITSSLNTIHKSQLLKQLEFKKIAFISNVSSLIAGGVALALAFMNFGVWALVVYNTLAYIITIPLYYKATKWIPKFIWKKEAFKDIFSFGMYTTGTQIINNIASNIDYLIIGKFFSANLLGVYTLAYMLTNMVKAQITSVIDRVIFPFYSSIQNDREKITKYYLTLIKYYSVSVFLMMLILIIFGNNIIKLGFGVKWTETIIPMKILSVSVMIDTLTSGYNLLYRSIGQPRKEMNLKLIIVSFLYIPSVVVGIYFNGIIGAAEGILFSKFISFILVQFFLKKDFNITQKDLFHQSKPALLASLIILLLFYPLTYFFSGGMILTCLLIILCCVVYLYVCSFFFKNEISMIRIKLKSRRNKIND